MTKTNKKEPKKDLNKEITKARGIMKKHLEGMYQAQRLIVSLQMNQLCIKGEPQAIGLTSVPMHVIPEFYVKNTDGVEFNYTLEEVPHELRNAILKKNRDDLTPILLDKATKNGWLDMMPKEETDG